MSDRDFVYTSRQARVIFGRGATTRLPEEAERLGTRRALALATRAQEMAAFSLANPSWNPRPLERDAIAVLIARAHAGERPVVEGRKST